MFAMSLPESANVLALVCTSQMLTIENVLNIGKTKINVNSFCHPVLSKPKLTSVKGIARRASSKKSTYEDTQSPLPSPTRHVYSRKYNPHTLTSACLVNLH